MAFAQGGCCYLHILQLAPVREAVFMYPHLIQAWQEPQACAGGTAPALLLICYLCTLLWHLTCWDGVCQGRGDGELLLRCKYWSFETIYSRPRQANLVCCLQLNHFVQVLGSSCSALSMSLPFSPHHKKYGCCLEASRSFNWLSGINIACLSHDLIQTRSGRERRLGSPGSTLTCRQAP